VEHEYAFMQVSRQAIREHAKQVDIDRYTDHLVRMSPDVFLGMAARMGVDPAQLRQASAAMQNMTPEEMAQASETVLGWVQVQASEPELVPASAQAKASELGTALGLELVTELAPVQATGGWLE
jgi:methylphosphotriester-DNA--protein-cysteine methyltransferase